MEFNVKRFTVHFKTEFSIRSSFCNDVELLRLRLKVGHDDIDIVTDSAYNL